LWRKISPNLLRKGTSELGISCGEEQIESFIIYLSELRKWNRAYNLTGLKSDRDIIIKHFLDSLLFIKVLPAGVSTVADIGSGAGFPGIPIKIAVPDLKMVLIEPTRKKAAFLKHIRGRLGLADMEIIEERIENIRGLKMDVAVTRALFTVSEFIEKTRGMLNENGVLILNKGPKLDEELKGLDGQNISVTDFKLPFENVIRHLVVVKKT
jgi:16S rRNA (guanine527-N7)-methyltransferase